MFLIHNQNLSLGGTYQMKMLESSTDPLPLKNSHGEEKKIHLMMHEDLATPLDEFPDEDVMDGNVYFYLFF